MRVLHDGTQEDVRAEGGGLVGRLFHERAGRVRLLADDELPVLLANGPAAPVEMEQRQAVVRRLHLRVIPALRQVRAGRSRELHRLARHRQLAGKELGDERFRGRIRRVVDDKPAVSEHLLDPSAEGVGHSRAGRIRLPQAGEDPRLELGRRQRLLELVERGQHGVVERHGRRQARLLTRGAAATPCGARGCRRRRRPSGLLPSRDPRRQSRRSGRPARDGRARPVRPP